MPRQSTRSQTPASPETGRDERVTTAVRLPVSVHDQLRKAAEERGLSANFLVVKAIEDFLERLLPADEIKLTRD